jgi:hypothetical protein
MELGAREFTLIFHDKSCYILLKGEPDARGIHLFIRDVETHSDADVYLKVMSEWQAFSPLNRSLKALGFIVNPIAGMGGAVGLPPRTGACEGGD